MADEDQEESPGGWRRYADTPEPEEFDPHSLGPEIPEAPDPSEADIDPDLRNRFWSLVLVFNVALLALSLGLMFAAFEGQLGLGGQLVGAGLVLSAFGYYRYRQAKRSLAETDGPERASD